MVPDASIPAGTAVGPYRIVRRLGSGAMGEVYLAHDPRLERDVAIKLLAPHLGTSPESRARFARETRVVASLDHPNIVTLYEVGDHQGRPYLVMQYLDGPPLSEFARERRLSVETVLDLGAQLSAGLRAAHERGVIHRDLKPSNILLDSRLRARLVDFGLARMANSTALTVQGSVFGTIGYLAPEIARGEEADERSDLFSLGVVLFELLTGQLPFPAASRAGYLYAVLHDPPVPARRFRADVPRGLEAVLERLLAKERAARYPSAAELGQDLDALKGNRRSAADTAPPQMAVAVLPFEDMSADRDQEYLCDGIAEELISALARIDGLRVIARTSAFAFKGQRLDVREIGSRLGVGSLLEGSVRKAGHRIRISARLIDARDGSDIWAERYERELDDIFAMQDEVCLSIASRLSATLRAEPGPTVVRRQAMDPGANRLYLQARFLFNRRTQDNVLKSLDYYRQAVERDPRFALAWAGLAQVYEMLGTWRVLPSIDAYDKARAAAAEAVKCDETLAEAHAALAAIRMFCDWDWAGAERTFKRALEINPACPDARHMYAHWHEAMGRFGDALAEMGAALDVEPVAPALHSCLVQILFHARRYDEAVRESGLTLEMAPHWAGTYGWMGMAHVLAGRPEVGVEALREGLRLRTGDARLEAL